MKKGSIFFLFGLIGLGTLLVGVFKKITHQQYADFLLTIGLLAFGIFYIMAIWDVLTRPYSERIHKMLWLLLVLFLPLIGSLIYHAFRKDKTESVSNR